MTAQRDSGTRKPGELTLEFLRLYHQMTPDMQALFARIIDALSGGPPLTGAEFSDAMSLCKAGKAAGYSDAEVGAWVDLFTVVASAGKVM